MNVAMDIMTKDDLSSVEKLQAYQSRMKRTYGPPLIPRTCGIVACDSSMNII